MKTLSRSPRCQRAPRVDFRRGPLGREGVCWSRRASRVQRGKGPESRSRWSFWSRRQTHTWRVGVVIPKMAQSDRRLGA
jgi:hypothetical protein